MVGDLDRAFRDALVLGLENDPQAETVLRLAKPFIEQAFCAQRDRIEKLEAENAELQSKTNGVRLAAKYAAKIRADRIEKLEAALREIAEANSVQAGPDKDMYRRWRRVATNAIDIARKALEGKDD